MSRWLALVLAAGACVPAARVRALEEAVDRARAEADDAVARRDVAEAALARAEGAPPVAVEASPAEPVATWPLEGLIEEGALGEAGADALAAAVTAGTLPTELWLRVVVTDPAEGLGVAQALAARLMESGVTVHRVEAVFDDRAAEAAEGEAYPSRAEMYEVPPAPAP